MLRWINLQLLKRPLGARKLRTCDVKSSTACIQTCILDNTALMNVLAILMLTALTMCAFCSQARGLTHWEHIMRTLETQWSPIGSRLRTHWDNIGDTLETHWEYIGDTLGTHCGHIGNTVGHMLNTLGAQWRHIINTLGNIEKQ